MIALFMIALLATAVLGAGATGPRPKPLVFYVAPNGNDAWSGRRARADRAKGDGPFATLQRARDAVREVKRAHGGRLSQPVTVLVRGGTYRLTEPLVFTPEDSGTPACPVTYAAYRDERPVISGGRRITGWKPITLHGRQLWTVDLPEVRTGNWYFHQLWVNGQCRPRARHPNHGFFRITGLPDVTPQTPWDQGQNRFQFAPGEGAGAPPLRAWENLEDVDVIVLHLWVDVRLAVSRVDEARRVVTFTHSSSRRLTEGGAPARYYVENALELLDAPGEWYLNRKTGTLYYLPLPGEELSRAEDNGRLPVIAPALPQLVRLDGRPEAGQFVEHLAFRGLTFTHAEWWLPRDDPGDYQAASAVPGAIDGDGVSHCAFEDCTIAHVSQYAIQLARGCRNNAIQACRLFDLGAGGVKIGEPVIRDDPAQQTGDNEITDNEIHAGGRTFHQAVGIWIGQSFGNRIAHNEIHDLYYTGISVGWTWGYGKTLARDNRIEANDVHHLGQGWLSDLGGIYTLGIQPGTVIRGNRFHDIAGYSYGGWGIYFDEGSSQIVAENNLVYRTTHGGFHQHYGRENVVRNNLFALGRDAQIQRSAVEPHRSFTFERNVVYWREGKLLAGSWEGDVALDHNLYGHAGGGEIRFGDLTWEQWRAQGRDLHSRIAGPLLVDPSKEDFRLQPGSPAWALGFEPLDLSGVGPRRRERSGI